jgi:starch synthase (maltosyl-transferring)
MQRLAKLGFSQSYTYFAWRTAKWELQDYLTELTRSPVAEYLRPNFWPNTPDILTEQLQSGLPAVFAQRLILAATMTASYGLYGPAFELQEHVPRHKGSEEYANSEKYSIRHWDLERPDSLAPLIGELNAIRRSNPALQRNDTLRFHHVDNDQLIVYSKSHLVEHRLFELAEPFEEDGPGIPNVVLVAVNLDPSYTQAGWVHLDLGALGVDPSEEFVVRDLLSGVTYRWCGEKNFVQLDPAVRPAHLFVIEPAAEFG